MNIFESLVKKFNKLVKPSPADFRRGKRKMKIIGYLKDMNSKHPGSFKGNITPMKRRFKGVSLIAKGK